MWASAFNSLCNISFIGQSLTLLLLSLISIVCPCVILPKENSKALQMVHELNRKYQVRGMIVFVDNTPVHPQGLTLPLPLSSFLKRVVHELVESGRYDTRPDFTVVIQPFLRNVVLPRLPVSNYYLHSTSSWWLYGVFIVRSSVHQTPSDSWSSYSHLFLTWMDTNLDWYQA